MKFSICIPNFNYANYLDKTLQSVLDQTYQDLEVLVSDNASTDASVQVAEGFADSRIQVRVNSCNVGFAGNLDRAGGMARGDRMIMLSSDDLMGAEALETYHKLLALLPDAGEKAVISSAQWKIDARGDTLSRMPLSGPPYLLAGDRAPELEAALGAPVYRVSASELLRRCVLGMHNPFYFAPTCYPRSLYEAVGGYGGGRLYNPDKWFHWRLLDAAADAYYIDLPLFSYRWHATNQAALQKHSGALKFMVDDYLNSVELGQPALSACGLTRADVERAFIERDIGQHGWAVLARDSVPQARRILRFGQAVYPEHLAANRKARLLGWALKFGPLAHWAAARLDASRQRTQTATAPSHESSRQTTVTSPK